MTKLNLLKRIASSTVIGLASLVSGCGEYQGPSIESEKSQVSVRDLKNPEKRFYGRYELREDSTNEIPVEEMARNGIFMEFYLSENNLLIERHKVGANGNVEKIQRVSGFMIRLENADQEKAEILMLRGIDRNGKEFVDRETNGKKSIIRRVDNRNYILYPQGKEKEFYSLKKVD